MSDLKKVQYLNAMYLIESIYLFCRYPHRMCFFEQGFLHSEHSLLFATNLKMQLVAKVCKLQVVGIF